MRLPSLVRRAMAAGGLVALGVLAGCTDSGPTAPSVRPAAAVDILLTAADVVVPGPDAGAFTNPITANESGWLTTEFWDNPSNDGSSCNVGFYAAGTLGTCSPAAAGSNANQGGFTEYWGNGPADRASSSFMFSGDYAYVVTLRGSYAAESSTLGWFTRSGGVYTFHPVAGWGAKTVGTTAIIPAGADWGIYLTHSGHAGSGTCATNTDCSDATGDMHAGTPPTQQFALFTNADESKYLVGVEDADEDTPAVGDDDFQDFILSVQPVGAAVFVIGDVEDHGLDDEVYFWGAQWWRNNFMSGFVSSGVASFKGYANNADVTCGGTWSTLPGNSSNPPEAIPDDVLIIVTSTVLKVGPAISGDIEEILVVHHDGSYWAAPGHVGRGPVTQVLCQED